MSCLGLYGYCSQIQGGLSDVLVGLVKVLGFCFLGVQVYYIGFFHWVCSQH